MPKYPYLANHIVGSLTTCAPVTDQTLLGGVSDHGVRHYIATAVEHVTKSMKICLS